MMMLINGGLIRYGNKGIAWHCLDWLCLVVMNKPVPPHLRTFASAKSSNIEPLPTSAGYSVDESETKNV